MTHDFSHLRCRNARKYANLDEYAGYGMAMEGVEFVNGLECKIACSSYKVLSLFA